MTGYPNGGSDTSFTVVIPAHNVANVLGEQLEALCAQDYPGPWDVVVVDNLSTDSTSRIARQFGSRLQLNVVDATARASAAHARNVGIEKATGEWIVFVDGDDVAEATLLSTYARMTDRYRVMGGSLDESALNDPIVAAWRYPLTERGLPIALGVFPFVLTSNCAISRDVFDQIGVFDENLEFFHEDVDFSIRVHLAGLEIGWVPEAVVNYRHRDSLRSLARQQYIWGRGSVVMLDRYRNEANEVRNVMYSLRKLMHVLMGIPNLVRGRERRGQWIRFATFVGGQVVQSALMRVWYIG